VTMKIRYALAAVLLLLVCNISWAQLTIQITKGRDNATPIAVVPFGWGGPQQLPEDVAAIVAADLQRSGLFSPMDRGDMLSMPRQASEVVYQDWRSLKVDYLLIGRMVPFQNGYNAQYELFDVLNQRPILSGQEMGYPDNLREVAHRIADRVYEKLTGVRGAFNTRLLYVSRLRDASGQFTYRLLVADADGAREQVLRTQREPIMSPSWSPNAQHIAYVSFETGRPAVWVENLRTRQRRQLTDFQGLNSSPVWSPDGNRMAMVLSKDGNPEVYVMDLNTGALTRITNHFAIDTEPSWLPDGRSLLFTSDRGGKPQIYRATLGSNRVDRMSFEGDYNARARTLPDGSGFIMVHREYGDFKIALQLLDRKYFQVLTQTKLDESPSVAPNGAMLIYATLHQGRTILAAVSVDGGTRYLLPSRFGDVREPSWSPFLDKR
jgi:TolB protein